MQRVVCQRRRSANSHPMPPETLEVRHIGDIGRGACPLERKYSHCVSHARNLRSWLLRPRRGYAICTSRGRNGARKRPLRAVIRGRGVKPAESVRN